MIIITEDELKTLKEDVKKEVLKEIQGESKDTYNTIAQRAYKEIFNKYFPKGEGDQNRRYRIKSALCTANNVLRLRTDVSTSWGTGRDTRIKNDTELENAIYTYRELCKAFKCLFQKDVYKERR